MQAIFAIVAVVVAMGLGISPAWAQTTRKSQPPAQSSPSPSTQPSPFSTTGRAQPQAPVGHRQPRAADVPPAAGATVPQGKKDPNKELRICRDC
jgi:hypothetical protein